MHWGATDTSDIIRHHFDSEVRIVNTAAAATVNGSRSFKDVWLISAGHAFTHWYTATFYLLLPLIGR